MKSFNYIIVNSLWIYHCIVRDKISQFSNSMPLCADWFVFQTESDYTKVSRIDNAFKWFNWKINIWAVLRIPGFAVFWMNAFQYMKSIVFRLSWGIFGIYQPQNITIHWIILPQFMNFPKEKSFAHQIFRLEWEINSFYDKKCDSCFK
jgi:hypothetical protein